MKVEPIRRLQTRIENRVRDETVSWIVEVIEAHADHDERGNKVLIDLILDEIAVGTS